MGALKVTLITVHIVFLTLAGLLIGGSIGGFLGNGFTIVSALLAILSWGTYVGFTIYAIRLANRINDTATATDALTWANRLFLTVSILSGGTGLILSIGAFAGCSPLYLSGLYLWCGFAGTILGLLTFYLLPVVESACVGTAVTHHRALWVFLGTGAVLLWGVVGITLHTILKDTVNPNDYKSTEKYLLPFPRGESTWVVQGNNTGLDHNDSHSNQRFAWDFRLPCGMPVLAAHSGTFDWRNSTDQNDGFSQGGQNNQVFVTQSSDNTVAFYLHIQKGSIPAKFRSPKPGVAPSTVTVNQGDEIAKVGCVGNTFTGHIHFEVRPSDPTKSGPTKKPTLGVKFIDDDVKGDGGIPRSFSSYTAGKG
jgi:hypothetical protein